MIGPELLRFVRHGVTPVVILAVDRGWLPEAAQSDVVEFLAIAISFVLAYGWSLRNELVTRRSAMGVPDAPGPVGAWGPDAAGGVESPRSAAAPQGSRGGPPATGAG